MADELPRRFPEHEAGRDVTKVDRADICVERELFCNPQKIVGAGADIVEHRKPGIHDRNERSLRLACAEGCFAPNFRAFWRQSGNHFPQRAYLAFDFDERAPSQATFVTDGDACTTLGI